MPWDAQAGGFAKHTKSGKGGGFVRNPEQYEKLRSKGMSKERAAAITNSDNVSKSAFGVQIAKADYGTVPATTRERRDRRNRVIGGATGGATVGGAMGARKGLNLKTSNLVTSSRAGHAAERGLMAAHHGGGGAALGVLAGGAAAVAGHSRVLARKRKEQAVTKSAFEIEKFKLTDPQGNAYQRPLRSNTRRQNVAVGSSVGGAEYGVIGAGIGAASGRLVRHDQGRHRGGPDHGASVVHAPPRALTRLKRAGKVGAAAGAVGAGIGAGIGAVSTHRKDRKKLPMGRVNKSAFGVEL